MAYRNIVILGNGAHSKVLVSEILKLKNFKIIGFVNYNKKFKKIITYNKKNYKNYKNIKDIKNIYNKKIYGIIGIGTNFIRKKVHDHISRSKIKLIWQTIVSKHAIIDKNVKIGEGSFVATGVVINTGTVIGRHCIINTLSSIDHDNHFDDFSSTGPRITTGGNVTVGKLSFIGIASVIKHKINIKENTIIGGYSFVNKNCKKNSIYLGIPIKRISHRKSNQKYL